MCPCYDASRAASPCLISDTKVCVISTFESCTCGNPLVSCWTTSLPALKAWTKWRLGTIPGSRFSFLPREKRTYGKRTVSASFVFNGSTFKQAKCGKTSGREHRTPTQWTPQTAVLEMPLEPCGWDWLPCPTQLAHIPSDEHRTWTASARTGVLQGL